MIPQIKKTIRQFILGESGNICKRALIKIGPFILLGATSASALERTKSWDYNTESGDHANCTREFTGRTFDEYKDKIELGCRVDTNEDSETNPTEGACLSHQYEDYCDNSYVKAHADFCVDTISGMQHGNKITTEASHDSCDTNDMYREANADVVLPGGAHSNEIALTSAADEQITATHTHSISDVDIHLRQRARYHDND